MCSCDGKDAAVTFKLGTIIHLSQFFSNFQTLHFSNLLISLNCLICLLIFKTEKIMKGKAYLYKVSRDFVRL